MLIFNQCIVSKKQSPLVSPFNGALLVKMDLSDICHTIYVQPVGSGLCGPYTIAHFADLTPEDAISYCQAANGWTRKMPSGMTTRQLYNALQYIGYKCEPRMQILQPGETLPKRCILGVVWNAPGTEIHGKGHWVLYNRGYIVCSGPNMAGIWKYDKYLKDRIGVCISYLEITK